MNIGDKANLINIWKELYRLQGNIDGFIVSTDIDTCTNIIEKIVSPNLCRIIKDLEKTLNIDDIEEAKFS